MGTYADVITTSGDIQNPPLVAERLEKLVQAEDSLPPSTPSQDSRSTRGAAARSGAVSVSSAGSSKVVGTNASPPTSQAEGESGTRSAQGTAPPPPSLPLPLPLPDANGSSAVSDDVQDRFYLEDEVMASGASTSPLSSPAPSPPPFQAPQPNLLALPAHLSLLGTPASSSASPKTLTAAQKGKGKAPAEPRMARARRSTASLGLAVGMGGMGGVSERKEVEELVRECRDRMANPSTTDGSSLPPIYLTTLPLSEVQPPPTIYDFNAASTSTSTAGPGPSTVLDSAAMSAQAQIETPSFRLIDEKAEEDRMGRLRKRAEEFEETMDAHYNQLHKKYETFEKRQRRREKERLQHERYKMKERVDLIRGMDGKSFAALVASGEAPPSDGTVRKFVHPEEIRSKMLEEAEEVLRRYDQLLPVENRMKQKRLDDLADDSGSDATPPPPPSFTRTSSSLRPPTLSSLSSHSTGKASSSSLSIKIRIPASALASSSSSNGLALPSPKLKSPKKESASLPTRKSKAASKKETKEKSKPNPKKRKRKRAQEEEEEEEEDEDDEDEEDEEVDDELEEDADADEEAEGEEEEEPQPELKPPKPRRSRAKPKPQLQLLSIDPPHPNATLDAPPPAFFEPYDEFKYWPRAAGMPMLEKTSLRHLETVGKELGVLFDALEAREGMGMEVDEPSGEAAPVEMEVDGSGAVPPSAGGANGVVAGASTRPRSSRSSGGGGGGPSTLPLALDPPSTAALSPPSAAVAAAAIPSLPTTAIEPPPSIASTSAPLPLPLSKPKAPRKAPVKTVSALVAGRAPRFNTPWGVKMPEIVGWKNDFDLDGEFWMLMIAEREQRRAGGGGGGGDATGGGVEAGGSGSGDGDVVMQ